MRFPREGLFSEGKLAKKTFVSVEVLGPGFRRRTRMVKNSTVSQSGSIPPGCILHAICPAGAARQAEFRAHPAFTLRENRR
jgi:hypothetical protein